MSQNIKQKLELTWIGKGVEPKLEPRILIEDPEYSYGDKNTENILIHGDNLLALKALEQEYAGKVKCIYIDPPYNTGNAFEHYDDGIEHSLWLSLMNQRLVLLKSLLRIDGVIFVQIDDEESAYLKVLMDEIFGRQNFINTISVNMKNIAGASGGGEDTRLKKNIEFIHVYCKNYNLVSFENVYDLKPIDKVVSDYRENEISWKYTTILVYDGYKEYYTSTVDGDGNEIKIFKRLNPVFKSINQVIKDENISEAEAYLKYASKLFQTAMPQSSIRPRVMERVNEVGNTCDFYSIEYIPKSGRNKGTIYEQFYKGDNFRLLAWLKDVSEEKNGVLYKKELQGTYWNFASETKNLSKEGNVTFPNGKKPESLIKRIIEMSTKQGDIVLDSFLGSGTTCAVSHKLGRKWIGVELGEQYLTHCIPRLKSIINGEQSGISKLVNWQGGGGFKFYELAPPLLSEDKFGNMVISPEYNSQMLAAAMAKHEGFQYMPDPEKFWKQGISSEKDYIFTTTQYLTRTILDSIAEDLPKDESLLICCTQFESGIEHAYSNINIRKIPSMLLNRCEFKQDSDYSFNIVNSPLDELRPEIGEKIKAEISSKEQPNHTTQVPDLFSQQPND